LTAKKSDEVPNSRIRRMADIGKLQAEAQIELLILVSLLLLLIAIAAVVRFTEMAWKWPERRFGAREYRTPETTRTAINH
jgi:hypothetical protein